MRKLKEVLRMHHEVGLGTRQIARSLGIAASTVHESIDRFQTAPLSWPPPQEWDDQRLEAALSPPKKPAPRADDQPDFTHIQRELQQHRHLTLQLLWEEYRRQNSSGYSYSRFCLLYLRWQKQQDAVLRQEHRAGEKMFVDWAGATIPIHNRRNAEIQAAPLFVGAGSQFVQLRGSGREPADGSLADGQHPRLRVLRRRAQAGSDRQHQDRRDT